MKNEEIVKLLDKYAKGDISDEELSSLDLMTHRKEVIQSAIVTAHHMRKQRRRGVSYVMGVLVLVCGIGIFMSPLWWSDGVQIVKNALMDIPVETVEMNQMRGEVKVEKVNILQEKEVVDKEIEVVEEEVECEKIGEKIVVEEEEEWNMEAIEYDVEPQVLCNIQCDADSVINEVWNFLKV